MWIVFILVSSILLLNLLIAIFNNKFDDFKEVILPSNPLAVLPIAATHSLLGVVATLPTLLITDPLGLQ